jgi:hypothetical protein
VDKRVCAEASPESGLEALDRELVPYGPDVLGIESTWREDGDIPCDAHAVISIGMDEAAFRRHLGSVR